MDLSQMKIMSMIVPKLKWEIQTILLLVIQFCCMNQTGIEAAFKRLQVMTLPELSSCR